MKRLLALTPLLLLLLVGCQLPGAETPDDGEKENAGEPLSYLGVTLAPQEDLSAVTKTFDSDETTIVVWKVNLRNNDRFSRHKLTAEWLLPSGELLWKEDRSFSTGDDATISITGGKGYAEVGGWTPGVYTLKFYLDGSPVAEEIFRVTGEITEDQEPILLAGVNFHYPDDITEPVTVFDEETVTEVIWFAKFSVTDEAVGRHQVSATWMDPDGKPLWNEARTMTVAEGQETVSVGGGQGYTDPAEWTPGEYTLMLTVDGKPIGATNFSVGATEDEPEVETEPSEGLDLYGLVFVDRDDYSEVRDTFLNDETEMIVWVVSLARQPDGPTGTHTITAEWYDPEEVLRWSQDKNFEIGDDEETKRVIGGRGYTEPGWWDLGAWTVLFYLDGEFIAMENFTIE